MRPMICLFAVLAAVAAGCDAAPPGGDDPTPSASVTAPEAGGDPVNLIGLWTVLDAGEEDEATLRLDLNSLGLFRDCGVVSGAWDANHDGLFVAGSHGWSGGCGEDAHPAWLDAVAAHRPQADGHVLLDTSGEVVARLTPGDVPSVPPSVAASMAERPEVTAETRAALAPAAPLPDGIRPADAASLLGRWTPAAAPRGSQAHAEFLDDATWRGSDGCNELSGRWRSGPDGAFLGVAGASTEIGCENIPVASHIGQAARAGFQDDALVLFDRDGTLLGGYHR